MNKREVCLAAIAGREVPYTPWNISFTYEARGTMMAYYGCKSAVELDERIGNHFAFGGDGVGFFREIKPDFFEDIFGVVWDRTADKDIGMVANQVIDSYDLSRLRFPDPANPRFLNDAELRLYPDRLRVYALGFSLFERAWTLRGMEQFLMDMIEAPEFAHELLTRIADWNIAVVENALDRLDVDMVHFGDDWGQQHGLIMGYPLWKEFFYPQLKRMYAVGKRRGKLQMIHSCGDVDELFDDLVGIGLNLFNPFQPEVMDVFALLEQYHGKLAFYGGLSTQRTLPYGSTDEVRRDSRRLIEAGRRGWLIFSPAHAIEGDVPAENMAAFIDELQSQSGVR